MIICPSCGNRNADGSHYCDACGTSLKTTASFQVQNGGDTGQQGESIPRMVEPIPAYVPPASVPEVVPDTGYTPTNITSFGIPAVEPEASPALETVLAVSPAHAEDKQADGEGAKNVHAKLTIERGTAVGTEFSLSADETYLGRWDADNGIFPDVDLDAHDPEAKVSRRHARIILKEGTYSVEDLGSTNGTFINRGRRLLPGNPNILKDGDELIVGKTFMRFNVIT